MEDHGGYYTDSQLLDRLVLEKLETTGEAVSREGWQWVAVYPEYPYNFVHTLRRIYPHSLLLSEEETTKLDELVTRHDSLIAEHGEDAPEDIVSELDRLAEEIASIHRRSETYLPDDLSRAGAIVSLSSEGTLRIERGFIKPEDAVQPFWTERKRLATANRRHQLPLELRRRQTAPSRRTANPCPTSSPNG